jgi:hypothetical protein
LEYLGLRYKPKAEVHPGHKLTDPKKEEEKHQQQQQQLIHLGLHYAEVCTHWRPDTQQCSEGQWHQHQ